MGYNAQADRDPRSRGLRHGVQGPRSAARSRGGDQGPRAGNLATEDDRNRFLREARSVAQLRHEAIVPVHEVGEHEEVPYLVSDFVEGVTLADWLTAHRLPFPGIAQLVAEVADALDTPMSKASFIATSSPPISCWTTTKSHT